MFLAGTGYVVSIPFSLTKNGVSAFSDGVVGFSFYLFIHSKFRKDQKVFSICENAISYPTF